DGDDEAAVRRSKATLQTSTLGNRPGPEVRDHVVDGRRRVDDHADLLRRRQAHDHPHHGGTRDRRHRCRLLHGVPDGRSEPPDLRLRIGRSRRSDELDGHTGGEVDRPRGTGGIRWGDSVCSGTAGKRDHGGHLRSRVRGRTELHRRWEPCMSAGSAVRFWVKYQGSDGAVDGWFADAPEVAAEVLGYLGGPQWEPVDVGDKTLIIVPASEGGIAALDASTGKSVWTTDGPRLREPGNVGQWGGQGALPDLGLVVLADNKKMTFFDAKTGKPVSDHSVGDYADLTSSQRFVVVGGEEKSTMRA